MLLERQARLETQGKEARDALSATVAYEKAAAEEQEKAAALRAADLAREKERVRVEWEQQVAEVAAKEAEEKGSPQDAARIRAAAGLPPGGTPGSGQD